MFICNIRYYAIRKKCVFSRHLKLARVLQVLIKLGKAFHRDAAATVNEPLPALVRVCFISKLLLLAERSALVG